MIFKKNIHGFFMLQFVTFGVFQNKHFKYASMDHIKSSNKLSVVLGISSFRDITTIRNECWDRSGNSWN